ncbi:MAG: RHS repeat-associated core domain-containing protein [Caulobacteraceae bacterium]
MAEHISTYDVYGQSAAAISDVGPGGKTFPFRYTGQRLDPATGLYDYKARDYSPTLGRFLQPDPAGLDQGPNLYEYVQDDPVDRRDPTGKATVLPDLSCTGSRLSCNGGGANPVSMSFGAAHGAGVHQQSTGSQGAAGGLSRASSVAGRTGGGLQAAGALGQLSSLGKTINGAAKGVEILGEVLIGVEYSARAIADLARGNSIEATSAAAVESFGSAEIAKQGGALTGAIGGAITLGAVSSIAGPEVGVPGAGVGFAGGALVGGAAAGVADERSGFSERQHDLVLEQYREQGQ